MKLSNKTKAVKFIIVIVLSVLLLLGGNALAQTLIAGTDTGGEVVDSLPPSYISGDPAYQNTLPPDDNPSAGTQGSTNQQFSYYQVAGATLRGRNSSTGYAYDGVGCTHVTSGSSTGMILNTEASMPEGSVIKYLRVYYNDTNPASGVEGYITRYDPGEATADLVHTGSTDAFAGGFGFTVSAEITETVNNTNYAYTLIGWPDDLGAANQICGLRIAYYAPFHGFSYLPMVKK